MRKSLLAQGYAYLRAAHFGPTLIVTATTFLLALSQYSPIEAPRVAIAIFAGQLVVGWSNDLIDAPLDIAAQRTKKPIVGKEIDPDQLRKSIVFALFATLLLSLISPLGLIGTLIHFLGLLSATLYNLKLKSTILSPLAYIVSFGALPWAIYLPTGSQPPLWLFIDFILISVAFHFFNVLKDFQWDINQGVLGLPQRFGRKPSLVISVSLVGSALLVFIFFH
ncbi:MAG: UbiA family prenyltransferase [Actinobacteria bacterium]|nr:UbiA family prenyltransferase [Actinomycetota bacterium]